MQIKMKDGYELTEEIKNIALGYDFYTMYIDNYGQMIKAQEDNKAIMNKIKALGVESLKKK